MFYAGSMALAAAVFMGVMRFRMSPSSWVKSAAERKVEKLTRLRNAGTSGGVRFLPP